jgi:hypothetical protein
MAVLVYNLERILVRSNGLGYLEARRGNFFKGSWLGSRGSARSENQPIGFISTVEFISNVRCDTTVSSISQCRFVQMCERKKKTVAPSFYIKHMSYVIIIFSCDICEKETAISVKS